MKLWNCDRWEQICGGPITHLLYHKKPLQFSPRMHSFQESASPRQCRHSGGLCACVRFLTLTPLRTGTSLQTSIQTCFGITGEDIFHLSASLLKCHYPRNSCWKVLSCLIIVSNIILLLNGLGKEKKWSSSYRVFLFSHLQFFKVRGREQ